MNLVHSNIKHNLRCKNIFINVQFKFVFGIASIFIIKCGEFVNSEMVENFW